MQQQFMGPAMDWLKVTGLAQAIQTGRLTSEQQKLTEAMSQQDKMALQAILQSPQL